MAQNTNKNFKQINCIFINVAYFIIRRNKYLYCTTMLKISLSNINLTVICKLLF